MFKYIFHVLENVGKYYQKLIGMKSKWILNTNLNPKIHNFDVVLYTQYMYISTYSLSLYF